MTWEGVLMLNVPEPYWDISKYRATLGHKFNHSFKYTTAKYGRAFHPRFGNIRTIYATTNITKGEEILVDYRYAKGSLVEEWYSELYLKETGVDWYSLKRNQRQSHSCGCGK